MKNKVAIFGAGGHGQTVFDAIIARGGGTENVVFLDDGETAKAVGGRELLENREFIGEHSVIVAIGDVRARHRIAAQAVANGAELHTVIHPGASVSCEAKIGPGTYVAPGAVIGPEVFIGSCCIINLCASVAHGSCILPSSSLNDGARIGGGVGIGSEVFIGMGAIVLPRVSIGDNSIIGAGAVVTKNVEAGITVIGIPAKPIVRAAPIETPFMTKFPQWTA